MKQKVKTCVGNKAVLTLYKKQDWWKSYVKNVLAQAYRGDNYSRIDQNSREVKRKKLRILFCYRNIDTLQSAFLWRTTAEGHEFWENAISEMRSYGRFNESDKLVYTYPLRNLLFSQ